MGRKCCVPGCKAPLLWIKVLPHPVRDKHQRFKLWLDAIGSAQLKSMDPIRVYQTKNICNDHFADDCFISDPSFKKLKDTCVPNKNLPVSDAVGPLAKLFASFQGEEMHNVTSDQQAKEEACLMSHQYSLHNGQSHNIISTDSSEGGVIEKRDLQNTQTIQAAATPTDNDDWSNISCPEVEVVAQEILVEDVANDCSLGQCGEETSFKLNDNIKNVTNSNQKRDIVSGNNSNSTTDKEATIKTYERSHKKISETLKKTAITLNPPIKSKLIKPKLIYTVIDLN